MEWVVTTGKTLAEAQDLALDQLGVDESDAEFEVLEEPKPGLFGRMRGEAKVRARVRPTAARPKVERRKRRGKDDAAAEPAGPAGTGAEEDKPKPARAPRAPRAAKVTAATDGAAASNGNAAVAPKRTARKEAAMTDDSERSERPTLNDENLPSVQEAATEFLDGLLGAFGLTGTVSVVEVEGEDDLEARIDGADLGVLIGPGGQTLQAMQELTRLAVQQRRGGARGGWLRVDVSGYRVKRREALERFTAQVVEQVLSAGTAKALEPMSAADRKVVHDAATRLGGVATSSEGEEPRRRVVIRPA